MNKKILKKSDLNLDRWIQKLSKSSLMKTLMIQMWQT